MYPVDKCVGRLEQMFHQGIISITNSKILGPLTCVFSAAAFWVLTLQKCIF